MNSAEYIPGHFSPHEACCVAVKTAVRPVHALLVAPALLFLATLTVMLFRPPDLQFYAVDRVAFFTLAFAVLLRCLVLRRPLVIVPSVTWPMVGMLCLVLFSALSQPFDTKTWSLLAAKFIVPFAMFHLALLVFDNPPALRRFEVFSLLVLAYLCFTAVAFLIGAKALIFPRFILDESLGIHVDRARGPFLQAVPNGVSLNILGLIALDSFRRARLRGVWAGILLLALPLAILATMTRAVWLSFAVSTALLLFRTSSKRLRRAGLWLAVAGTTGLLVALSFAGMQTSLQDRAEERGPVEIRWGVYKAGWRMFLERPLSGWGTNQMPAELANRMTDYHLQAFWVHNTYLEILVEHGIVGLILYGLIISGLFRLGMKRRKIKCPPGSFLDTEFRNIWPIILGVYLFNATFVVMNYQFVNGLLFTLAGMVAAQNRTLRQAQIHGIAS